MKRWYWLQTVVLGGGTLFAWWTVAQDFSRFYRYEGTIFKLRDCIVPNPVTTPCFWGAIAFLVALIWSVRLLRASDTIARVRSERRLRWLLVAGVLFAWGNVAYVVYNFYTPQGTKTGCSGLATSNPFTTPCFIGAVIYLLALLVSLWVLRREKYSSAAPVQ